MPHINEGDEIGAGFLNNHEDVWEWWRRYKARGEGGVEKPTPVNFSKVMGANYTGVQLYIGDVCEFDGNPFAPADLSDHYPDPRNERWLKIVTPDLTHPGWGIALDPIPGSEGSNREGGEFLVLGACHAKVVIADESHEYAERRSGFRTLFSTAKASACKILHKPPAAASLPELRLCLVQIMDEGGDYVDIVQVNHTDADAYEVVEANAGGVHPGRIKRVVDEEMTDQGPCWILFVDQYDTNDGNITAINTDYYGPARYSGTYTFEDETRDLLVVRRGYQFFEDIAHFELSAELEIKSVVGGVTENPGHAKAKLLKLVGGAWVDSGTEIEVFDWFGSEGMWNGYSGYRGWAKYRETPYTYTDPGEDEEDPEDDEEVERDAYEIIWMERIAQKIRFTTTSRWETGQMTATVTWYDHQGKNPGSSVTVFDPDTIFPDTPAGAKGIAYYNNKHKRYEAHYTQGIAIFASATVTADVCPGGSIPISDLSYASTGRFVLPPTTPPSTASGLIAALAGDSVKLRRVSNDSDNPSWEVVSVSKHEIQAVIATRVEEVEENVFQFQNRVHKVWVELCKAEPEEDWIPWHTGTPCPEEEEE